MLKSVDPKDIFAHVQHNASRVALAQSQLHLLLSSYVEGYCDFDVGITEALLQRNITLSDYLTKTSHGTSGLWWALLGALTGRKHAWEHFKSLYEQAHKPTLSQKLGLSTITEVSIQHFLAKPSAGMFAGITALSLMRYGAYVHQQTEPLVWIEKHLGYRVQISADEIAAFTGLTNIIKTWQQQLQQAKHIELYAPPTLTFRPFSCSESNSASAFLSQQRQETQNRLK
ncbi:MAG: hypothetical protein JSR17_08135 [Proteobacteria bacterium]|nr:hypothetical protein [Pseudomonadota bacterium]